MSDDDKLLHFLQERYHILASKYYNQRCKDDESCVDYNFFQIISKELLFESIDDEVFFIFEHNVSKENKYPTYPLYKTLTNNLLQWIIYSKYSWPKTQLDNIIEINVEFSEHVNALFHKFKNIFMSLLDLGDLVYEQNSEISDLLCKCNVNNCIHPATEELQDIVDNSSLIKGNNLCSYTKDSPSTLLIFLTNNESPIVDGSTESASKSNNFKELDNNMLEIFRTLQKEHILKLLGIRKTVGSAELLPPPLNLLWQSYCKIHHPKSRLIVGARALSKHCHRSSDCWWGNSSGTEENKNKHALKLLENIFVDITWINMHHLPHGVIVLEVRCSQGYGLRWSDDGSFFRGFLEPQMVDGYDKKWKH